MTAPATGERALTIAQSAVAPITTENTGDQDDPSIPSLAYTNMIPRRKKHRACFQGTEAIRRGGRDFVPQYDGESDPRYAVRVRRAAFYNGYARTVQAAVGLILAEEPKLDEDNDARIIALTENIDAAGTHLAVLSKKLLTSSIVDSKAGLLAEFTDPSSPKIDRSKASAAAAPGAELSSDDEIKLGLRPYLLLYKDDDIYRELYETVNGVKVLTLLILRETVQRRKGKFGVITVTQYRVYTNTAGIIAFSLWEAPQEGATGRPTMTRGPITVSNQVEIPWSPLITGDEIPESPGEYKAALSDLADLNIQYHISLTDHLSLQSLAYVPTPVRIGANKDHETGLYPPVVLGPGNTLEAPFQEGIQQPIYWLSPPVDVLEFGESTLVQTKADMANMGAAFLSAETRAAETAEGKRIDSAASRATLTNIHRATKDCLERAVGFMARYLNTKGGSVVLTKDFTGEGPDTAYMQIILSAYQADTVTLEELRHVLQTGQLPEDFDNADVMELLLAQEAKLQREADAAALANPGVPRKPVPPAPRPAKPATK